jgi:hypothetical protein
MPLLRNQNVGQFEAVGHERFTELANDMRLQPNGEGGSVG